MKRQLLFLFGLIISISVLADVPQGISHQAVIRDYENNLIVESPIGLQVSILQGAHDGEAVYVETHQVTSNQNGLITYIIGNGDLVDGVFEEIDWGAGPYWLETKADPDGGTNYSISGVTRFLSVPYALHTQTAEEYAETDPLFMASPAADITEANLIDWDTAFSWGDHDALYHSIDWTPEWAEVLNKPDFADVAFSGSYEDLTDKPQGTYPGEIRYWDGSEWLAIVPGETGQTMTLCNGVPQWGPCIYTLSIDVYPPNSGTAFGAGQYEIGQQISITATPEEGWVFSTWTGDTDFVEDITAAQTTVTMPADDILLTANFQEIEPGPALLTITVICEITEMPIQGAWVDFYAADIDFYFWGATDENGQVILPELAPGQYELNVGKWGEYLSAHLSLEVGNEDMDVIVHLIPLTEFAPITITVFCSLTETPLEDAWVDIHNGTYVGGQTDENGQFTIPGLPPGQYVLYADKVGYGHKWLELEMGDEEMEFLIHLDPQVFTLVVSGTPPEGGVVDGTGDYLYGDEVQISAEEADNWLFGRWIGDVELLQNGDDSPENMLTMPDRNVFLEARFYSMILPTVEISLINNTQPGLTNVSAIIQHDPGPDDSFRGFVWSTEENPNIEFNEGISDDHGTGLGEFFIDLSGLTLNTKYYIRAYATNSEGTAYSEQFSFVFWDYEDTVTDVDDNVYNTVIIGNQEWMTENLRVTRYSNEDHILTGLDNHDWENTTEGAYAIYPHGNIEGLNSDADVVAAYGKLYNWYTVDDERGLCPEGWIVPSQDDWTELVNYVVSQGFPNSWDNPNGAGNALKSCRQQESPLGEDCDTSTHPYWYAFDDHYGFDEFGFAALPGGGRWPSGDFYNNGGHGFWWSSSEHSTTSARYRGIHSSQGDLDEGGYDFKSGFSVRCIRYIPTYNLNLNIQPENAGAVTGAGEYQEGAQASINATARLGWEFVEWTGDTEHINDPASANTVVTMPAQNISLTANYIEVSIPDLLFFEDFTGIETGELPELWEATHSNWGAWHTNNAGGESAPELRFNWSPNSFAEFRAITPLIDASDTDAVELTFMYSLNDYSGDYTLKVQTSPDGESWVTHWEKYIAPMKNVPEHREASIKADIPPANTIVLLDGIAGEEFHIAFVFDGNSYNTNQWYIDDIFVLATTEESELFNLHLNVHPEHAGSVMGFGDYEAGETVEISAAAEEGWVFVYWTGDTEHLDDADSAETTVTMPAFNITLTANFQDEESEIIYGEGVTDIDGNEYVTVIIGDKEWMAENLRVTRYNNEDDIPMGLSDNEWLKTPEGAYVIYPHGSIDGLNSDEEVLEAYGALYNWYAVNTGNLCPEGWLVPSHDDWTQLEQYICNSLGNSDCETHFPYDNTTFSERGTNEGNALKTCRQVGSPLEGCNTSEHPRWDSHSTHYGFDEYGFSALPGGLHDPFGIFSIGIGDFGIWWSTTEFSDSAVIIRSLISSQGGVSRGLELKRHNISVRCFRPIEN